MTFTDNEIVLMAKEACTIDVGFQSWTISTKHLQIFAEMVAAKERRECSKVCAELGEWPCVHAIEARGEKA